jgi:hypothetical protein
MKNAKPRRDETSEVLVFFSAWCHVGFSAYEFHFGGPEGAEIYLIEKRM